MARKTEATLLFWLLPIAAFAWLQQKVGWFWLILGLLVVLAIGLALLWPREPEADAPSDEFGPIFPTPNAARAYYSRLMKVNADKAQRLRIQQILRESLQIALASKNPKTAASRIDVARQMYDELFSSHRVPAHEAEAIRARYERSMAEYQTARYLNAAAGLVTRAGKLKTERARRKYLDQAREVLEEGLGDAEADARRLRQMLAELDGSMPETAGAPGSP